MRHNRTPRYADAIDAKALGIKPPIGKYIFVDEPTASSVVESDDTIVLVDGPEGRAQVFTKEAAIQKDAEGGFFLRTSNGLERIDPADIPDGKAIAYWVPPRLLDPNDPTDRLHAQAARRDASRTPK